MKKYLVLATLILMSSYAHAANMTWYGSAGWLYSKASQKDGTTNTAQLGNTVPTRTESVNERQEKSHMLRGELGATGGWDNIEWGTGIRTTGTALLTTPNDNGTGTVRNSSWRTVNTAGDLAIGVNKLWFKYGNDWGFGDIGLTIGRQAPVFATGEGQIFIDSDVNFDGFGWSWKWGSFGFNANQYVLGAVENGTAGDSSYITSGSLQRYPENVSNLMMLYSFQPTFKWKFTDEISALFAVGYHQWSNTLGTSFQNLIPNGGTAGFGVIDNTTEQNLFNNTAITTNANGNHKVFTKRVSQENSRMWQFLTNWNLPFMLKAEFELILNNKHFYAAPHAPGALDSLPVRTEKQDDVSWSASLSYGALKKAHDFMLGFTYHDKSLGGALNAYTYDLVQAGMGGAEINLAYNIASNFHVGGKLLLLHEKNSKTQDGIEFNKKVDTNYWEVATGVKF